MTADPSARREDDRSLRLANEDLNQSLIEQFYEDSVARYGLDSEQARAFLRLLSPVDSDSLKKNN
jgi:hypothetical protein